MRKNGKLINCMVCRKQIYRSKRHLEGKKNNYCSYECFSKGLKGRIPWNKGLTNELDKRIKFISSTRKGKTWEEIYGVEKAKKMKKYQSKCINGNVSTRKGKTFEEIYGVEKAKKMKEHNSFLSKGENNSMFGKHFSDGTKRKMRAARLGTKDTLETRRRKSKSRIGKLNPMFGKRGINSPHFGRKATIITRKKIREAKIKYIEQQKCNGNPISPTVGKYETQILNNLEKCFGYKILRQHKVLGYFLDGYCPMLHMAIEVDEPFHYRNGQLKEKDIRKQKELENEFGYKFLRIQVPRGVQNYNNF